MVSLYEQPSVLVTMVSLTMTVDNIRYSVDVCLFSFPNASGGVSSPCTINWGCQPLKKALEAGSLDSNRDQFEYCTADGDFASSPNVDDCIKCFASSTNQGYMSNCMNIFLHADSTSLTFCSHDSTESRL